MNIIKKLRIKSGFTQKSLAKASGLSLRTIQRLEASGIAPKGHTLKVLSDVLNIEPATLRAQVLSGSNHLESEQNDSISTAESELQSIKMINLSVLAFFVFPFGNMILPFILWKKKKASKLINEIGKKIINVQIIWSVSLMFLLSISPFIDRGSASSIPLILWVLLTAILVKVVIVGATARAIDRGNVDILNLPFQLI